jgi:hypothetical protein
MADDSLSKPVDVIKCKEVIDHLLQEKFTLAHYWEGLTSILRSEGISDTDIEKIERRVAKAIKKGDKKEVMSTIKSVTEKAEIAGRLLLIADKIVTLFG